MGSGSSSWRFVAIGVRFPRRDGRRWPGGRTGVGAAVAAGAMTEDAAAGAGVSSPVGFRWFRHAGGVNPRLPETVSGSLSVLR